MESNITPPLLHVGKQVIYFLPDVALIDGLPYSGINVLMLWGAALEGPHRELGLKRAWDLNAGKR